MKKNKFDSRAKEIVIKHETPVDSQALWNNLENELYPKKDRKRYFWLWFIGAFFIGTFLLGSYSYFNGDQEEQVIKIDSVQQKDLGTIEKKNYSKAEIISQTKKNKNVVENSKKINTIKAASNLEPKTEGIKNNQIAYNKSPINEGAILKRNKNAQDLIEKVNHKESKSIQQKGQHTDKDVDLVQENLGLLNPAKISNLTDEKDNLNNLYFENNEKAPLDMDSSINKILKEVPLIDKIKKDDEKPIVEIEIVEPEMTITNKEEKPDSIMEEEDGEKYKNKFFNDLKFGLGVRAGIASSITSIEAKDAQDLMLKTLRNNSETSLESVELGLNFLIKHKSGVYLSSGLDYFRSSRKLNFNDDLTTLDSLVATSKIYVNLVTQDSTFEQGVVGRVTTRFERREVYNHFHMVNIPLMFGVDIDQNNWSFGLQGGALINILVKQKGQILESENSFYDLGKDSKEWFKNNTGLSFQGSCLIGYRFTDNFQLVGGPSFRSPIQLSSEQNPLNQKQLSLGIKATARYWFD